MPRLLQAFALCLGLLCAVRAHALTAVVPDDFPTIQLAVDSPAETVYVRGGDYPERVTLKRNEVWQTLLAGHPGNPAETRPRIGALLIHHEEPLAIARVHVAGGTLLHSNQGYALSFTDCRLDSGLVQLSVGDNGYPGSLSVVRSVIRGSVSLVVHACQFESDTLIGGGLVIDGETGLSVNRCVFLGSGTGVAIRVASHSGGGIVQESTIDGYDFGILMGSHSNDFHGEVHRNLIRRCTRAGMQIGGSRPIIAGNDVQECPIGIYVSSSYGAVVRENRVLACTRAGIEMILDDDPLECRGNVVGRSGEGIWIQSRGADLDIRSNTVYLNEGSGLRIGREREQTTVILGNIAHGNREYGLRVETSDDAATTQVDCNDWFANQLGPVSGIAAGPHDLNVDPRFCEILKDFVHLASDSPLLDAAGCGRIGALGLGCAVTPPPTRASLVTPCEGLGWAPIPGSDQHAAITDAYPSTLGSLAFEVPAGASSAGWGRAVEPTWPLSSLSVLGIDLLLGSTSTAPKGGAAAVRLLVDNGQTTDRYSWLVWETRWNGDPKLEPDAWSSFDLLTGRFWQSVVLADGSERAIEIYRTLPEWLAGELVKDKDGDASQRVGPAARIRACQIVAYAPKEGVFRGAADRLRIGLGGEGATFDFEPAHETTALETSVAVSLNRSVVPVGGHVTLTATILPSGATGDVEFFDGDVFLGRTASNASRASLGTVMTVPGHHAISALYLGDACHRAARSAAVTLAVLGPPALSIGDATVVEGDEGTRNMIFPVRLSHAGVGVSADYTIEGGTAEADQDFVASNGTLTFGGEGTETILIVAVIGDLAFEHDETLTVRLTQVRGAEPVDSVAVGIITDDDRPRFSVGDQIAVEGTGESGSLPLPVRLLEPAPEPFRVAYRTIDGAALAIHGDYVPASGTVEFQKGEIVKLIPITVCSDSTREFDESFGVEITATLEGVTQRDTSIITIKNDDRRPDLFIDDAIMTEGHDGSRLMGFRLHLSHLDATSGVEVRYVTMDGSATAGLDYRAGSGRIYISGGVGEEWLWIEIASDAFCESPETFSVKLTPEWNAAIRDNNAVGTILDEDCTTPTLVSLLGAAATASGIELRWRVTDGAGITSTVVERSQSLSGPWVEIAVETRVQDGTTIALDREVSPGRAYWYRLAFRHGAEQSLLGPISATAARSSAFALGRIAPNPSRAATTIEFGVGREGVVRLSVLDVQGREVAVLAQGVHAPGEYVARWNGEDRHGRVRAGLYFVRYQGGEKSWTRRLVISR